MLVFSRIQKKDLHFQQNFIISVTRNDTFCIWKKKVFFEIFFWNFQKNFFVKSRRIMLRKGDFQKSKKVMIFFFFKITTKSRKIDKSNKCQRFQIGKTLRFSEHIDFFEFGLVQHRKLTKNTKKIFKKNFFFQMCNVSTCLVRHKLKLQKTKSPHLRNI